MKRLLLWDELSNLDLRIHGVVKIKSGIDIINAAGICLWELQGDAFVPSKLIAEEFVTHKDLVRVAEISSVITNNREAIGIPECSGLQMLDYVSDLTFKVNIAFRQVPEDMWGVLSLDSDDQERIDFCNDYAIDPSSDDWEVAVINKAKEFYDAKY